jgi:hypothetical protein
VLARQGVRSGAPRGDCRPALEYRARPHDPRRRAVRLRAGRPRDPSRAGGCGPRG